MVVRKLTTFNQLQLINPSYHPELGVRSGNNWKIIFGQFQQTVRQMALTASDLSCESLI